MNQQHTVFSTKKIAIRPFGAISQIKQNSGVSSRVTDVLVVTVLVGATFFFE